MFQQNPIDSTLPATFDVEDAAGWILELDDLLTGLFTPTAPPLLPMGETLWAGLASIVVVWTGLRIAFGGANFNFWDVVTLILGLAIPLGMLRFYATDFPGVNLPFPFIIPAGADQIAALFQADISAQVEMAQSELSEAFRQNAEAARSEVAPGRTVFDLGGAIKAGIQNFTAWLSTLTFGLLFSIAFIAIYAICLAQVLWAKIAIAILIFLGPVLIPWMVWKPMAFLFWGWFRAMWTYSLYSIIAAAVARVFVAICITMINSVNAAILSGADPVQGPAAGAFLLAIVPLTIAAFLAALKVPELAGAIVGGSGGGSGFLGVAASAASGGTARMAKMAAGAVK